jgi:hypothetical protein
MEAAGSSGIAMGKIYADETAAVWLGSCSKKPLPLRHAIDHIVAESTPSGRIAWSVSISS